MKKLIFGASLIACAISTSVYAGISFGSKDAFDRAQLSAEDAINEVHQAADEALQDGQRIKHHLLDKRRHALPRKHHLLDKRRGSPFKHHVVDNHRYDRPYKHYVVDNYRYDRPFKDHLVINHYPYRHHYRHYFPHHYARYHWETYGGYIPDNAVVGGSEPERTLYICQSYYLNGVHPGKLVDGRCNITYAGREISRSNFRILVGHGTSWRSEFAGIIPARAIPGGYERSEDLYICRTFYRDGFHPGKIVGGNCNIGFDGREISRHRFKVLVS